MGFSDRFNAVLKNADSKIIQASDESKYNSKIDTQKAIITKAFTEAGELMYKLLATGKTEIDDEVRAVFKKVDDANVEIERLIAEKEKMIADRQAERDARNEAIRMKQAEERAARDAAKAEEKAARDVAKAEEKKEK